MEVDSSPEDAESRRGETRVAVHPLAIVHMTDQYTRISSGGSPFEKNAPVVGLLFGLSNDVDAGPFVEVLDADDIPVEVSDASKVQVDLHKAVFPKHKVVGWYRVVAPEANVDIEPNAEDLTITKLLKSHYASSDSDCFCFCLLKVEEGKESEDEVSGDEMKTDDTLAADRLVKELPINLYELHDMNENIKILLGLSNWELETSPAERFSIERVMKERPSNEYGSDGDGTSNNNAYVLESKVMQHSLVSMNDRVRLLTTYLESIEKGKQELDRSLLRKIQQIVCSLGPLSSLVSSTNDGEEEDLELLAHLSIVARTVNSIQSYTEKFRVMNESRKTTFERHSQTYF